MPPIEFVSEGEFYALVDRPYNAAPECTPGFSDEHEQVHAQMKHGLSALEGEEYNHAFNAREDGWTESRYVAAFLRSPNFIRNDLFSRLHEIVESFKNDYAMHILSDFDDIPEFELFITKHRFLVLMPDRSQLSRLFDETRQLSVRPNS